MIYFYFFVKGIFIHSYLVQNLEEAFCSRDNSHCLLYLEEWPPYSETKQRKIM